MRILTVALCAAILPAILQAQTPMPPPVPDPAFAAAATLARLSGVSARQVWDMPSSLDSAVATSTKKKNDKRTLGLALMIVGVGAIVGGAVYGGSGGLAIIIAGGIMEGYGYTLYHGGKW